MRAGKAATETKSGAKKKSWFFKTYNEILEGQLSVYEKMVYIALASYADKNGTCFPSAQAIAERASCSRAQVFRAIRTLEAKGLIVRNNQITSRRGQSSNIYVIAGAPGLGCRRDAALVQSRPQSLPGARPVSGGDAGLMRSRPPSPPDAPPVYGGDAPYKVFEPDPEEPDPFNYSPPSPPRGAEKEEDYLFDPGIPEPDPEPGPEPLSEERLIQGVIDAYNDALPELPRAGRATQARASEIRRRLNEDSRRRELAWWRRYFRRVREYPWLMGERAKSNGWRAHFDWLLEEKPMQRVLEGSYPTRFTQRSGRTAAGDAMQKRYMKNPEGGVVDAKALLRDLYESGMA